MMTKRYPAPLCQAKAAAAKPVAPPPTRFGASAVQAKPAQPAANSPAPPPTRFGIPAVQAKPAPPAVRAPAPPPTRLGVSAVQAKPAQPAARSPAPPPTRFGAPAVQAKALQAYFVYKQKPLDDGDLDVIRYCIEQNYGGVLKDFNKKANNKQTAYALTQWLKDNGIKDSVATLLSTTIEDDDDNISVFSDFNATIDNRFSALGGISGAQKVNVGTIRETMKGFGKKAEKEDILSVFGQAQSFNTQSTFAFARKISERKDFGDYVFSTKLSVSYIKYLYETLTMKGATFICERDKGTSNTLHAEKLIATDLLRKGEDLSEWEIFISQPRCPICAKDKQIDQFGAIYEADPE